MEKDNAMKILAVGIGLLVSIIVLWFGFRLVQYRLSHASANITNDECTQDADSPSTYTATFELGEESNVVDVVWGLGQDTLTSRAEANCDGTNCTVNFDLVPADSTPFYLILVGGIRVGSNGTSGDNAKAFECTSSAPGAQANPIPTTATTNAGGPTILVATPTKTPITCAEIRSQFPTWNPAKCFAAGYTAAQCACMTRDSVSDGR